MPTNPTPSIEVSYNGIAFINSPSAIRDIGSFVQNTSPQISIRVKNVGDTSSVLSIANNGIVITSGDGTIPSNPSSGHIVNITNSGSSITFNVALTTVSTGLRSIHLKILSNDPVESPFFFNISFTVNSAQTTSPDMNILHDSIILSSQGVIDLGDYPIDTTNDISFDIYNFGTPELIIPEDGINITSSGDGVTLVSDPVDDSSETIDFGESVSFQIRLDTSTLGSKTAQISVSSNDTGTDKNPYEITVSYNVAKAYELVVKETSNELTDEEAVNLGSFNRRSNILKGITAINRGIFYNIRILGIISSGDVELQGIPLLPLILQPNEVNSLQFTAKLGSTVIGRRTASIQIQWEVVS